MPDNIHILMETTNEGSTQPRHAHTHTHTHTHTHIPPHTPHAVRLLTTCEQCVLYVDGRLLNTIKVRRFPLTNPSRSQSLCRISLTVPFSRIPTRPRLKHNAPSSLLLVTRHLPSSCVAALELICRAHQLVMEGHKGMFNDALVTVWSAPNYCYRCGNVAAILELDEHLNKSFKIFEAAPQESRGVPAKKPAPDYFL